MVRQQGNDPEKSMFRQLLLRLRDGCTTEQDWAQLLTRTPANATNISEFDNAIHLFYDKQSVAQVNINSLTKLGTPIARINAIHSCSAAASAKSEMMLVD